MAEILNYKGNEENSSSAHSPIATGDSTLMLKILKDSIDALPSGLAVFDAEDRLILVNNVYRKMLPDGAAMLDAGASFLEMARRNAEKHFGINEKDIDDWMAKRLAYRDSPNGCFDQKLSDGRWCRIEESRTSDGGTVTNWTDITDLKLQEQVTDSYSQALMTTNQQLKEFAHAASHDLQEPLRKIETFGGRLSEKCGDQLGESGAKYLDRIIDATGRMRRLVEDLLSFAKATDKKSTFEEVELNTILQDALYTLDLSIDEQNAQICIDELPRMIGDFTQLSRLFQNLLSNAMKYVAPGTISKIQVEASSLEHDHVTIAIRDNGIGFEQKNAEKIFEAFQRLHGRSGQYEGSGIGLASCRKIVDQHEGSIRAESTPNVGSTFFVTLPLTLTK